MLKQGRPKAKNEQRNGSNIDIDLREKKKVYPEIFRVSSNKSLGLMCNLSYKYPQALIKSSDAYKYPQALINILRRLLVSLGAY